MDQIGLHRSGKICMLASSAAQRSPLLPEVPTFAEAGLKGVEGTSWFAVYAPAKTPEATVRQVNAAINKALASPELRERFGKLGLEPTGGGNEARHRALGTGGQGVGLQGRLSGFAVVGVQPVSEALPLTSWALLGVVGLRGGGPVPARFD